MTRRIFGLALAAMACSLADKIPLANFTGKVHGTPSGKQITIENEDGNLVDFEINHKTVIKRGKKPISASEIATGDTVVIEAKQEMVRFLVAVTITVQPKIE